MPALFTGQLTEKPTLDQFVLLSILMHVLVIALFGDTGTGGGSRAQRLWGTLQVSMQRYLPERGAGPNLDAGAPRLRMTTGMGSPSAESRSSVRRESQATAPIPAESVSASTASSQDAPAIPEPPASRATSADDRIAEMPALLATEPAVATSDFVVPRPRPGLAPIPSAVRLPEMAPLPAVDSASSGKPTAEFAASTLDGQNRTPLPPPLLEKTKPPSTAKEFAPPLPQPKLRELPYLPPLRLDAAAPASVDKDFTPPPASKSRESLPAPLAPAPAPAKIVDKEFLPIAESRLTTPVPTPEPLNPTAPAQPERSFAPPLPESSPRQPANIAPVERINAPSAPQAFAPAVVERRSSSPAAPAPAATGTPDRFAPPVAAAVGATSPDGNRQRATPDPFDPSQRDGGTLRGTPLPADTMAPPRLDIEALRSSARNAAREGSGPRTLLSFPTPPKDPVKKSIEQAFDKALKRPECKDAYASLGLAAVVPLVRDVLTDDGCKW
ncbi:MAG: hypothetical protein HY255_07720 [Betaproteobacteria bacterium]|nr:hypothetical protein [Betaproteobacteria bacterium]